MKYGQTIVVLRDSKALGSNGLTFTARVWQQFTDSVKHHTSSFGITAKGLHGSRH
jgi:hypothetical protein